MKKIKAAMWPRIFLTATIDQRNINYFFKGARERDKDKNRGTGGVKTKI